LVRTQDTIRRTCQLSDFTSSFAGMCLNFPRGFLSAPEGFPYRLGFWPSTASFFAFVPTKRPFAVA